MEATDAKLMSGNRRISTWMMGLNLWNLFSFTTFSTLMLKDSKSSLLISWSASTNKCILTFRCVISLLSYYTYQECSSNYIYFVTKSSKRKLHSIFLLILQVLDSLTHNWLSTSNVVSQHSCSNCTSYCQVSPYAQGTYLRNQCRQVKLTSRDFRFDLPKSFSSLSRSGKMLYLCIVVGTGRILKNL